MRRRLVFCLLVALVASCVAGSAAPIRILFMHHSTGANLIQQGGLREGLSALGYEFSDHGYNEEGLCDARGNPTGANFAVPDDNTDPDGWAAVFAQPVVAPPANTLSWMLGYDVVLFKSCFPSSNITDEEMLSNYKTHYLSIRAAIDRTPDRLFIAFTPPPLVPSETDPANAARARAWAEYLTSDEFRGGRKNLAVFDFFSLLADANGVLRQEYRGDEWDSHPNRLANEAIGPRLVDFVRQAIVEWQNAGG
jgi:hypothetical protein